MMSDKSKAPARILVVDDETAARSALTELLREEGYEVQSAGDGFKALGRLDAWNPEIMVTDLKMPGMDGIQLMEKARERSSDISVVVMTAFGTVESAVEAIQQGADDYLTKPLHLGQLLVVVERVLEHRALRQETERLRNELARRDSFEQQTEYDNLLGRSRAFREMMSLVEQVASSDASVLLVGENGTGKESVAVTLHELSKRREGPFVPVHCAAMTEDMLDRELFGYEAGYGGATDRREGRFVQAAGGTLFLDEVADLPMPTQAKILRALQEGTIERMGGSEQVPIDVRLLAASDRELHDEVQAGAFREDLFYRLNVICVRVPTLRERRDDIPLLAMHFLERHTRASGKPVNGFTERALGVLLNFDWPGNITQLESCIERAVVLARGDEVEPRELPRELMSSGRSGDEMPSVPGASLRELERFAILKTLEHVSGSTSKAARILGISPRKIQYRLNEYREEDAAAGPMRSPDRVTAVAK
ncbi:Transcriptional regulatory protein ZraR [Enhygromyxa salina]|uniref:Transcriptional regulatory protein ZraR n=1 Tax=Enhygromyxa salina TaxID=215803 RepID=A0A2S9YJP1_9BACT|nr:sigma-54 dependent transcriptional regulator [Enhygromyxa salina]PRQ05328.1 Transcriptional regulatory protein ZraR [Enhygromyxa salina]